MLEPPAKDSFWDKKEDWKILHLFAASYYSLYLGKCNNWD